MRPINSLGIAGALVAFGLASEAHADLLMTEKGGHVTEGIVTIDASPSAVYALVTDYAQWRAVFSDVLSVTVKSGGPRDATVRFKSRALDQTVTVKFDNTIDRQISFIGIKGPPGGRASGTYVLTPVDGGRRTRIHARLYMDAVGLAALFVSDSKIRKMRQAKLRADLTDVMRRFPTKRSAVEASR